MFPPRARFAAGLCGPDHYPVPPECNNISTTLNPSSLISRKGKMVIVVDDEDRENEGDLIMAAQFVTPAAVNFMAKFGRGLICVPTTSERLDQLGVGRMVRENRESFRTDFQVSVDAAHGISTGISAADRRKPSTSWPRRRRCRGI